MVNRCRQEEGKIAFNRKFITSLKKPQVRKARYWLLPEPFIIMVLAVSGIPHLRLFFLDLFLFQSTSILPRLLCKDRNKRMSIPKCTVGSEQTATTHMKVNHFSGMVEEQM